MCLPISKMKLPNYRVNVLSHNKSFKDYEMKQCVRNLSEVDIISNVDDGLT